MDNFLTTLSTKLKTQNYNGLNLVIGNESCDLDSAVSAIVYALFLNWHHQHIAESVCTRKKCKSLNLEVKDDIYIPILNVEREDFGLKTEVVYCFKQNGIQEGNLVFRNDYDWEALTKTSNCKAILVDHHVLAKKDQFLAPLVTEVIDHRPLSKSDWIYKDDARSLMEITGSCCTLIAQRMKDLMALFPKDVGFFDLFPDCAKMLHATIILDTVNFSTEVKKATPHDKQMIDYLESFLKPNDVEVERVTILEALVHARSDVSSLTAAQLLKKDVKIVGNFYVPSFPLLVKDFLTRPGAMEAIDEALSDNHCSVALLLGMDLKGGLRRDAAVYSSDKERAEQLAQRIEQWKSPALELIREQIDNVSNYYTQTNLAASRKQYMPILNDLLDGSK